MDATAQYVTSKEARRLLGTHDSTLRQWANHGLIPYIRTPGGDRRYNVSHFVAQQQQQQTGGSSANPRQRVCYCRGVSKDDLSRRVSAMQARYPNHKMFSDIGSCGKRRGLYGLMELACKGLLSEVVVADEDHIGRMMFDIVEWTLRQHGVRLVVEGATSEGCELAADDMLSVVQMYGRASKDRARHANNARSKNG